MAIKMTPATKESFINLYNKGLMDTEIAKKLGVTDGTIFYWRKKLGLKTKFDYSKISKIDKEQLKAFINKGFSDCKIASLLNVSSSGIYYKRKSLKIFRESLKNNKPIKLTQEQKETLVGTLMGDASLRKEYTNACFMCSHCVKQKEYIEYKNNIFKSIGSKLFFYKRNIPNEVTKKLYKNYTIRTSNNPNLNIFYESFYKDKVKHIPFDLLEEYFTPRALAFMFMDDGYITKSGYCICTNCFSIEELSKFQKFLKSKFNLNTSIFSNHVLYIKASSKDLFTFLISPYIIDCLKYKLHSVS